MLHTVTVGILFLATSSQAQDTPPAAGEAMPDNPGTPVRCPNQMN
jgi:hypothetical protein